MSGRGDTFDQMMFVVTLNSVLGTIGAGIVFRLFVAASLTRRIDVIMLVLVVWIAWTFVYLMVARSILQSASKTWSNFLKRFIINVTYVVTFFTYLYLDDLIRNTTLMTGMSAAEALVYVIGGLMLLSAIQSLFEYYAVFELTRPDRTHQDADANSQQHQQQAKAR